MRGALKGVEPAAPSVNHNANNETKHSERFVVSMNDSASDDPSSEEDENSWINWFCSLKGNEFFTEVDAEYIMDDFNLTGLRTEVPNYDYALDMILDHESDEILTDEQQEVVECAAEILYGLIHSRFILTARGLSAMMEKMKQAHFGRCPRVMCQGQTCLPVGQSDIPRINTVKLFCPKCEDIYYPRLARHQSVDGAYFGTTFSHLLLHMYPELRPPKPTNTYVPRIYGFRIHESAYETAPPATPVSAKAALPSSGSKVKKQEQDKN
mmetsp:Transcript_27420/g.68827  ORF Transcript_27420/g.68827 Transcript_27420/m.68827 type:complete len:267 (-) Transcript_27420:167-967(-)